MTCCGKKLVQIAKKAGHITEGAFWALLSAYFVLPKEKCTAAEARLRQCRRCEYHTWMSVLEFGAWILKNIGTVRAVRQLHQTEQWPQLPKQAYTSKRKLFCRICKCWLPAKTFIKKENCSEGQWKDIAL